MATVTIFKDSATDIVVIEGPVPVDQSLVVQALLKDKTTLEAQVVALQAEIAKLKQQPTLDFSKNPINPIPPGTMNLEVWLGGVNLGVVAAPNGIGPSNFTIPSAYRTGKVYTYSAYAYDAMGKALGAKVYGGSFSVV